MTIARQLEQNGIKKGILQGIQQGREEGREEGIRTLAHTMLQQGMDYDIVIKLTGLSMEELVVLSD